MSQPSADKTAALSELQQWFASECNGDWEHSYGVVIETLDNPGWSVVIDLNETLLACRSWAPVKHRGSDGDWVDIEVTDAKFVGAGDPTKLMRILAAFIEFKNSIYQEG